MTSGERKLNELLKDDNRFQFLKEYCQQNALDPDNEDHLAQAARAWNAGRKMSTKDIKDNTPSSIGGDNTPRSIGDFVRKGVQSQYADNKGMMGGEFQNVESVANLFLTTDNKLKSIKQFFTDFAKNVGQQVILYFTQQNDLLEKMGQNAGILGDMSEGFRNEITMASPAAAKLGISFTELSDVITDITAKSGKMKLLDEKTISNMALVSKFSKDLTTYSGLVPIFEKVGLGVGDMNREIEAAGRNTMGLGLNARTIVTMIGENLDKLNTYGFKNGVKGITEMAQKAVEFRMDMNKAFVLADKVWSPEGALDVVANLQVIGGAFGDLNDPIKLMYMATNNVEGLQDAIQGAAKSLVTFNQEQGRFEVTGANLRRAKEMADQFGMSVQELTTAGVAGMERMQAASELASKGLNLPPDQVEFLTNLARMEGGKMVISIPENLRTQLQLGAEDKTVALEALTQAQAQVLIREQDALKKKSMEEIAIQQVSLIENINRDLTFLVAAARIQGGKKLNALTDALGWDPAIVGKEASELSKKGVGIINSIDKGMNKAGAVQEVLQKGKLETGATTATVDNRIKTTETTTEAEKTTQKIIHEHKFEFKTGDNALDAVKRGMMSDTKFVKDVENGFLEEAPKF